MITNEQIEKYNTLRLASQDFAKEFAAKTIADMNLLEPWQRGEMWSKFKEQSIIDDDNAKKSERKAKREASKDRNKNKASVSKTCKQLLALSLPEKERGFISDISKRNQNSL